MIADGKVAVNGKIVTDFSFAFDPECDSLTISGRPVLFQEFLYVALFKPSGVVTSCSDEQDRTTVMELLPPKLRHLRPVGRLDMYSEGLLVLTNDGDLTQKLTHPAHHVGKLYEVRVRGSLRDKDIEQITRGVELDDGRTAPAKITILSRNKEATVVKLLLHEGRNRQIRRMFAALDYRVLRLVRIQIGRLQLGQMAPGDWRYLGEKDLALLSSEPRSSQ